MSFFLLDRDRADGSLRILSSAVYESRDEAMAALSSLAASGATSTDHDVFIADLAAATPVLLVPQAGTPAPESASAWEAPSDDALVEVQDDGGALAEAGQPGGLAGALRRAATSLESEGIVAPESVPSAAETPVVPEPAAPHAEEGIAPSEAEMTAGEEDVTTAAEEQATDDGRDGSDTSTDDLVAAIASLGEPASDEEPDTVAATDVAEPMGVGGSETAVAEEAPDGGWPWANVEPVGDEVVPLDDEAPDTEPVVAPAHDETPDAAEDTAETVAVADADEESMIRGSAIGDDEFVAPKPVIMGEYGAEDPSDTTPPGYEGGDVQLSDYTCEDCVYANTCPKAGESSPAACGSFQWKSV